MSIIEPASVETSRLQLFPPGSFCRRFLRRPMTIAGLCLLTFFLGAAVLAGHAGLRDPMRISTDILQGPSMNFLFGTDDLGRDVFSGVVHGARTSLTISFAVVVLSGLLGLAVGLSAGYAGGLVDDMLMRTAEIFMVPPRFLLALVAAAIFGATMTNLILVLTITYWPATARIIRAAVLSLRERGFVEAARAMGAGHIRIIGREILPGVLPLVVTNGALKAGNVILVEAGLEFLGLGDPNNMSWGYMLHNAQHYMRDAWWLLAFPGIAISLLLLSLNLLGDELSDSLRPRR